jgi:hypothetical protein
VFHLSLTSNGSKHGCNFRVSLFSRSDVVGVVVGMSAGTGDGVDGVLDGISNRSYNTTGEKGIAVSRTSMEGNVALGGLTVFRR